MKAGFGMNIIGILVVTLSINTYGRAYFHLNEYPKWALDASSNVKCGDAVALLTTRIPMNLTTTIATSTAFGKP
eukprot:Seg1297.1 transcript_id=Seg1297.1/GoldUCD/mRNA.D3Y31 product="hypothetical protein" protein_id=Seg1297.1/GoldUCD/D3Y31